ncbi:MAG: UDP-N-acetylmuramoyl-L-alanine--D-glutamate ligase [Sedimentisphaerales bacterium]|nr:UDP-N-acetylmuramoyl-L-alanine--D-glutamate ligase [Sedimentisphaerales bacterium]
MQNNKYDFAGKTVLVMGLGRFGGGVDVTKFAHGAGAKVIVTDLASAEELSDSLSRLRDLAGIEFHLGSHDPADFEQADVVIVNPAVPGDNKFLQIARRANRLVTSQISIFFKLCPAKIIGITGANGKSTTTALTAHLLKKTSNETVWLSGNIGNQPLLTALDQINPDDLIVLELSSFQLEQLADIKKAPDVALLTNLTPNHLDRYGTFENYCAAKENIFKYQKPDDGRPAVSIFNAEDKIAADWFEKYKNDTDPQGAGRICTKFSADDVSDELRNCFALPGRANLSNLAAAMAIAKYFGAEDDSIKHCLPVFKALPHRLELVETINGVSWYNDSKATTPEGAITALDAFDQPIIIIAGGYDKNISFDKLGEKIAQKAKAAILIGKTSPKIDKAIQNAQISLREAQRRSNLQPINTKIKLVDSLAEAVQLANQFAFSGNIVLLSPACASYDMFENYEQRGLEFTRLVKDLCYITSDSRTTNT